MLRSTAAAFALFLLAAPASAESSAIAAKLAAMAATLDGSPQCGPMSLTDGEGNILNLNDFSQPQTATQEAVAALQAQLQRIANSTAYNGLTIEEPESPPSSIAFTDGPDPGQPITVTLNNPDPGSCDPSLPGCSTTD